MTATLIMTIIITITIVATITATITITITNCCRRFYHFHRGRQVGFKENYPPVGQPQGINNAYRVSTPYQ